MPSSKTLRKDGRVAVEVAVKVPSTVTSRVSPVGPHSISSQEKVSRVIVVGAMVAALRSRSMTVPSPTSWVQPDSWIEVSTSPVTRLKTSVPVP